MSAEFTHVMHRPGGKPLDALQRQPPSVGLIVRRPAQALTSFVSHYWLGLGNGDPTYTILPDGCVDVVFEVSPSDWRGWAYGTATRPAVVPLTLGSHYLGVRFKPGQSRHFIDACALALTDTREELRWLTCFSGDRLGVGIETAAVFDELDGALLERLRTRAPTASYVDHVVHHIRAAHGNVLIDEVASWVGKSRRQVERSFLEVVGMPSKLYASIVRLEYAAHLIRAQTMSTLAEVAVEAGYSDQSHMTRDFARLTRTSPGTLRRGDVAFFQYSGSL